MINQTFSTLSRSGSALFLTLFLLLTACRETPDFTTSFQPFADFEEQESTLVCWNRKHKQVLLPVIATIARQRIHTPTKE